MKAVAVPNYQYQAAGRSWALPVLNLIEFPDGSTAITEEEIRRVHVAIANEICGSRAPLSVEELDFLCDTTDTPLAEVARLLDLHKSTLSKWRSVGHISRSIYSLHLKKLFWFKLFGPSLADKSIPMRHIQNEQDFLRYAHERALREKLADPVELAAA